MFWGKDSKGVSSEVWKIDLEKILSQVNENSGTTPSG